MAPEIRRLKRQQGQARHQVRKQPADSRAWRHVGAARRWQRAEVFVGLTGLPWTKPRFSLGTCVKWVHRLFNTLSQGVPVGFGKVSLVQILRADRELLVLMTHEVAEPMRPDAGAPKTMDVAMGRLIADPRLMVYVIPVRQRAKQVHYGAARKETMKVTHAIQKQGLASWEHQASHEVEQPQVQGCARETKVLASQLQPWVPKPAEEGTLQIRVPSQHGVRGVQPWCVYVQQVLKPLIPPFCAHVWNQHYNTGPCSYTSNSPLACKDKQTWRDAALPACTRWTTPGPHIWLPLVKTL